MLNSVNNYFMYSSYLCEYLIIQEQFNYTDVHIMYHTTEISVYSFIIKLMFQEEASLHPIYFVQNLSKEGIYF